MAGVPKFPAQVVSPHRGAPRDRDLLADTYTDLKQVSESDTQLSNLAQIVKSQVRFAEVATAQISNLKTRCAKAEERTAVLYERVKWLWWVIGGLVGVLVFFLKTLVEWRVSHS